MEKLVSAFTALITKDGKPSRSRAREVDVAAAPASVQALAGALAAHDYNVSLGELSLYASGDPGTVTSLAETIEMACEKGDIDPGWVRSAGGPGGGAFDPANTLQLGADGGGMSYFGVSWSGGELAFVVVEFDDPTQDNLLKHFAAPGAWLDFVEDLNHRRKGPFPALDALRAAVS